MSSFYKNHDGMRVISLRNFRLGRKVGEPTGRWRDLAYQFFLLFGKGVYRIGICFFSVGIYINAADFDRRGTQTGIILSWGLNWNRQEGCTLYAGNKEFVKRTPWDESAEIKAW